MNIIDLSSYINFGLSSLLYLTVFIFGLYTLAFMYHWFVFGINKSIALLALLIHFGVSFSLISIAYFTLQYVI